MKYTVAAILGSATLAAGSVHAGGMETGRFSPAFMFENGNYLELSYGQTSPSVSDNVYSPNGSMLGKSTSVNMAVKVNLNDKLAVGISSYESAGINLSYAGNGGPGPIPAAPLFASLGFRSTVIAANYAINDRISVLGGIKLNSSGEVSANILNPFGVISGSAASSTGYVLGASYQIPDIALRVSAIYQSKTTTKHDTTLNGAPTPQSQASLPESLTLEFQTGIAKDTLLFGSIHHAKWSNAHVYLMGAATPVSTWTNSTTYNLGVGRKLNDNWAISAAVNYEKGGDAAGASLLSTTNGVRGITLGGKYTRGNMSVTAGVNYSMLGDKTVTAIAGPGQFKNNKAVSFGLKVGYSF